MMVGSRTRKRYIDIIRRYINDDYAFRGIVFIKYFYATQCGTVLRLNAREIRV